MRLSSIFVVFIFLISFSEMLSQIFNYAFVVCGLVIIFFYNKRVVVPKNFKIISSIVLIFPLLQYAATGNYAGKWMLNYSFYCVGMIGLMTLISHMREISFAKINDYLRFVVFVAVSVYILYPVFEHGFFDSFTIDRNYLYATANSLLPADVLVKQKMAALIMLYILIVWEMIRNCNAIHRRLSLYVLLILAVNMLVGSRSQTIGLLIAVVLITAGSSFFRIKLYAVLITLLFGSFLYLMTADIFTQLSAIDIRVMLFHSAAVSFFDNILSGIGLFYLPQYLQTNNDIYFLNFAFLYPETYQVLNDFPTGFESSFMQFSLELGVLSLILLYYSTKGMLSIYSSIEGESKYLVLFLIAYVFSSLSEDNLTQPAFYVMVSVLFGFQAFQRRCINITRKLGDDELSSLKQNIGVSR